MVSTGSIEYQTFLIILTGLVSTFMSFSLGGIWKNKKGIKITLLWTLWIIFWLFSFVGLIIIAAITDFWGLLNFG